MQAGPRRAPPPSPQAGSITALTPPWPEPRMPDRWPVTSHRGTRFGSAHPHRQKPPHSGLRPALLQCRLPKNPRPEELSPPAARRTTRPHLLRATARSPASAIGKQNGRLTAERAPCVREIYPLLKPTQTEQDPKRIFCSGYLRHELEQ